MCQFNLTNKNVLRADKYQIIKIHRLYIYYVVVTKYLQARDSIVIDIIKKTIPTKRNAIKVTMQIMIYGCIMSEI